jgi:hypothetical protein
MLEGSSVQMVSISVRVLKVYMVQNGRLPGFFFKSRLLLPCRSDMYKNDSDCVAEFINLISSESNEICSKEEKRTIAPEHVLRALEVFFLSPFPLPFICAFVLHSCPENCFLLCMSP